MKDTQYIVSKYQILGAVEAALEEDISNAEIVEVLMKKIRNNVETVLEDDCDEMTEDMWEMFMA